MNHITEEECTDICNRIKHLDNQTFVNEVNDLVEKTNIYEYEVFYETLFFEDKGIIGVNMTDNLFNSCLYVNVIYLIIYEKDNYCNLVNSYERFVTMIKTLPLVVTSRKYSLITYIRFHLKYKDYFVNSIKEMPEIWSHTFIHLLISSKSKCKLICEHMPYEKSMVDVLQKTGKLTRANVRDCNLELFLKTTNRIIECYEYEILIYLCDDKYKLFPRKGGKIMNRATGYMLNNKYTEIKFYNILMDRGGSVEWDPKIYNVMKLLIRKQKLIKPAKNYSPSNADALEKWKLNFMRSFEYHNNLHKLKLSCKI